MTFSVVARCRSTGMFGVAVCSSSPAVAARCAHARADAGAVATQNITDPELGSRALDLLAAGATASEVLAVLGRRSQYFEYRQLLIVDREGVSATHSGAKSLGICADASGRDVACGGNLLAGSLIPQAMVAVFLRSDGHLGDRLIETMSAGLAAGGEAGPVHSAGMKIVREMRWPIVDLRCDWTEGNPIEELAMLWRIYKPQIDDYVTRASDPTAAPSYGVPGDE